jgi:hypothetical protein
VTLLTNISAVLTRNMRGIFTGCRCSSDAMM